MQNKTDTEVLKIYDFFNYKKKKQNQTNLLWPCFLYEVRAKTVITDLNIFEYYVLRMFSLKNGDVNKISEALCLEKNLVNFVVSALKTKYFIDGPNLTKNGAEAIDNYIKAKTVNSSSNDISSNVEDNSAKYVETSFNTFVDRLSGQLLPFICNKAQMKNKMVYKNTGTTISYYSDSEREHKIHALKVEYKDNEPIKPPSQKEVLQLLLNCQRKYKKNKDDWPDLSSCRLVINQNPKPILVHFSLEVDKNFGDLVVSNETGESYFKILSSTLEKNTDFNPWIRDLKKSVVKITSPDKKTETVFVNTDFQLRQIEEYLKIIEENVPLLDLEVTDSSLYSNYRIAVEKIINNMYLVVESIFKYHVSSISEIKINEISEYGINLKKSIIKNIFKEYRIEHNFTDENFRTLSLFNRNEVMDMIALSLIIESKEENKPLRKLFSLYPNFLLDLLSIEKQRNNFSHSSSEENAYKISAEKIKKYISLIQHTIQLIIPTFVFSTINKGETKLSLDQTDRIKASLLLEQELPSLFISYVKRISTDLFKYYVDINVLFQKIEEKKSYDEYNLILQLTRFLEATFSFALSNETIIDSSKIKSLKKYKRTGIEIIKTLCTQETDIDETKHQEISSTVFDWLKTVREKNIVNACHGENSTLGGLFIALFLRINDNKLKQIIYSLNKNNINISNNVYKLVNLRKHNESTYVPLGDIKLIYKLKINVFFIVKSILENTNE